MREESGPARDAITTSPSRPVVLSRRRSRWLIIPSGWMLVVCLFLPAFRFCDQGGAVPMAFAPSAYPLYVIGAFIAAAAAAPKTQFVASGRRVLWVVRASAAAAAIAMVYFLVEGAPSETLIGIGCAVLVVLATWREPTEVATATIGALASGGSVLWGVVLSTRRFAPWGAYVTMVTAGVLVLGCLWWLAEAVWARRRARVL